MDPNTPSLAADDGFREDDGNKLIVEETEAVYRKLSQKNCLCFYVWSCWLTDELLWPSVNMLSDGGINELCVCVAVWATIRSQMPPQMCSSSWSPSTPPSTLWGEQTFIWGSQRNQWIDELNWCCSSWMMTSALCFGVFQTLQQRHRGQKTL